ncbi:hypothetical protein EBB07_02850 [Paenibacillaceae bacterium]|nr:hypothetical protein EBB07_02850 [Paenibacillaceae bacterium]
MVKRKKMFPLVIALVLVLNLFANVAYANGQEQPEPPDVTRADEQGGPELPDATDAGEQEQSEATETDEPSQSSADAGDGNEQERPAPTDVTAEFTANSVQLSWSDTEGATAYNVYRAEEGEDDYVQVNSSLITATEYLDTGLAADTTFEYKVQAISEHGVSGLSQGVSGATAVDFGPNVKIYDSSMNMATIQTEVDQIFGQ